MTRYIPSYELYGDLLAGSLSDPVHHESIKERSSKHDWTIRLHRHRRLAQIFLFRSPEVFMKLGDVELVTAEPTILVVPPGVPHGFTFSEDVVGDVLSIRLGEMPQPFQARFEVFGAAPQTIFVREQTSAFDTIAALFTQVSDCYHSIVENRATILTTLVDLIALYLAADLHQTNALGHMQNANPRGRQDLQAEAFCTLLEDNFQRPWPVAEYAEQMGISAPHLTRICRTVLGSPPNSLVRQRRILEAKRLLEYTGFSIAEIAHRSGFREAAFFSRSFKSAVGQSPHDYRRQLEK